MRYTIAAAYRDECPVFPG